MMSNNTYSNNSSSLNNASTLAKDEELQKFESSFFPAGGAPQLANIPPAPPAPTNFNNVRSSPMNLKTRNWGPKLENGYGGLNRSLYDRPNVFNWDSKPILGERTHLNNNNNVMSSFPPSSSSSTSTTSTSRSVVDNIPVPPAITAPLFREFNNPLNGRRLRIRNWGYPADGWSGMNRELYNPGMRLERDVLLNQLRYTYGPRPNFQQQQQERSIATETNFVETVPTTTLVETGPAKVLATTVPVPMLNPPINDGRRYAKLYKRNTNALASEKGLTKLVKRRGTRRDHLVQPNTAAPMTSIITAAPYAGATIVQPATLVAETRSVLPATGVAPYTAVAPLTTLAPVAPSKAELKREKRAQRDQQKFVKKEQRAARKQNKKNGPVLMTGPSFTTAAPILPATTFVGTPALQTAALPTTTFVDPALQNATFVGETRSVLSQEATFLAPTTTTAMPLTTGTTTSVLTPVGVSAQPLDHAHVLAGQLGNAPVKRPRRARKAKKGTEQPMYSNIISSTPAPLTAVTTNATTSYTTTSSLVQGTTVVQPATLVGETRNIIVDPLVQQQGMIKQDYNTVPAISPLAVGNPIM